MNLSKLDDARMAANLFLQRAREVERVIQNNTDYWPKETGALHRASMELTRALAELRKPR